MNFSSVGYSHRHRVYTGQLKHTVGPICLRCGLAVQSVLYCHKAMHTMSSSGDNGRGIYYGIIVFFSLLIVAQLLYILFDRANEIQSS